MFLNIGYCSCSGIVIFFRMRERPGTFFAFSSWAPKVKIKPCNETITG